MEEILIGHYINGDPNEIGSYSVKIYSDGTRIKETLHENATEFKPSFPDSLDCKITQYCPRNCKFCHENSSINGKHGDILNTKFIDSLSPYTEIAIGGGEVTSHPDLIPFLKKLKNKNVIANITVSQEELLEKLELLHFLVNEKLIYGLGVSYRNHPERNEELIKHFQSFPNLVVHVINGVINQKSLYLLANKGLKILILGYKNFRRGKDFYSSEVEKNKELMYKNLPIILSKGFFKVVSFDNLALSQLQVKCLLNKNKWDEFYQGEDGKSTLYVSIPDNHFAVSSISEKRYLLQDDIKEIFEIIKKEVLNNEST